MRKNLKIPRIIKLDKIEGFKIYCMFNNGEKRLIDFSQIFKEWNIDEQDIEFPLLKKSEFKQVKLNNYTLSWENVTTKLITEEDQEIEVPYEIDPVTLYQKSKPIDNEKVFRYGTIIRQARKKAGLTQEQLAMRSGTTRFYISRIENNRTDIELSTFRKIVEAGLGRNLRLEIE